MAAKPKQRSGQTAGAALGSAIGGAGDRQTDRQTGCPSSLLQSSSRRPCGQPPRFLRAWSEWLSDFSAPGCAGAPGALLYRRGSLSSEAGQVWRNFLQQGLAGSLTGAAGGSGRNKHSELPEQAVPAPHCLGNANTRHGYSDSGRSSRLPEKQFGLGPNPAPPGHPKLAPAQLLSPLRRDRALTEA